MSAWPQRAKSFAACGILPWILPFFWGCSDGTSLLVSVSVGGGTPSPSAIRARLFGNGQIGPDALVSLSGKTLPGRLLFLSLDPRAPDVRVLIDGLDATSAVASQATARVSLSAGKQTQLSMVLTAPGSDADGDGVPDAIDDCPVPDPAQTCVPQTGVDGGAIGGCPQGALFCDDFETGDTRRWEGTMEAHPQSVIVDHTRPFRGQVALHASDAVTAEVFQHVPTQATGILSTRFYVFAVTQVGGTDMLGWSGATGDALVVGIDGSGNWTLTENNRGHNAAAVVPSGRWLCVELEVDLPPTRNLRLFVDGAPVIDQAMLVVSATSYDKLAAGVVAVRTSATPELFIDDVAVANQHIGCE
jgi:hypothetical protein